MDSALAIFKISILKQEHGSSLGPSLFCDECVPEIKKGLEVNNFKALIFYMVAGTGFEPMTFGL